MIFTDYIFEYSHNLDEIAVIHNEKIRYRDIYDGVLKIQSLLKNIDIVKGDTVVLISDNSRFFIESYFGIIKNGNVCVPINPTLKESEIGYIIDTVKPKAIFIQNKYMKKINCMEDKGTLIITEDFSDKLQIGTLDNCNKKKEKVSDEDVAVMIFTSGSTSKPKGVMLTHKNLIHNTNSIIEYLKLTKNDRVEVVLPFYYCYGTSLLHTHFRVCGSLVINNKFMFPQDVLEDINKYSCTSIAGVPSTYQILLRMTDMKNMKFNSLRYITQAGGMLANSFIKELIDTLPNTDLYIMYGQTEGTARLSYLPPEKIKEKLGSIGKGIPGVALKVVNENGECVKVNEVGHLIANGENVMRGYFNNPEETKMVIRDGWLYTGDLAQIDEDGYIYIVAREKNIIKSGGNRISPREIEDVIVRIPQVIECAVVGVEDDFLGEGIKAFIVVNDKTIDHKYIINFCKENLSSFKVPKYIEFMDSLPKNSSGKVLFKKLKEKSESNG